MTLTGDYYQFYEQGKRYPEQKANFLKVKRDTEWENNFPVDTVVAFNCNPRTREPAWSTEQVLEEPGLHRETVSQKTRRNKTQQNKTKQEFRTSLGYLLSASKPYLHKDPV